MAQLVSSRSLLVSSEPLAVGVINDPTTLRSFAALPPKERLASCDLAELRLDELGLDANAVRQAIDGCDHPFLLTARHPAEGGKGPEDAAGRAAMIEPLLDRAALIDLELRSIAEMPTLLQKAREAGVGVVGSFHDFTATPAEQVLRGAAEFAQQAGLDAVKFATYLNQSDDLSLLMRILTQPGRLRLSAMGMGPLGRVSRLVLAKCGSLLNYGYLGDSNAPGQWPAHQLKQLLSEI